MVGCGNAQTTVKNANIHTPCHRDMFSKEIRMWLLKLRMTMKMSWLWRRKSRRKEQLCPMRVSPLWHWRPSRTGNAEELREDRGSLRRSRKRRKRRQVPRVRTSLVVRLCSSMIQPCSRMMKTQLMRKSMKSARKSLMKRRGRRMILSVTATPTETWSRAASQSMAAPLWTPRWMPTCSNKRMQTRKRSRTLIESENNNRECYIVFYMLKN